MKNQEKITQATFSIPIQHPTCQEGKVASSVCLNSNCNQQVFMCGQKYCLCYKTHKSCLRIPIQSIAEELEARISFLLPFENKIYDLIQKTINQLSQFREEIIEKAHLHLNNIGLSKSQRKFRKIIKKGQNHQLSARQMHKIYMSLNNKESFLSNTVVIEQKINKAWKVVETGLARSISQIKKLLAAFSEGSESLIFSDSNIIDSEEQRKNLSNFFSKPIANANLLYCASENNFSVDSFYQNCSNIPDTLIICKTEGKKVIGGYTPNLWKKYPTQYYIEDQSCSKSSFIFSLSNNQKFTLQPHCYAIKYNPGMGPIFGNSKGVDFGICDKANLKRQSIAMLNYAYCNNKYKQRNEDLWLIFLGVKSSPHFLMEEWEAWQITFEN